MASTAMKALPLLPETAYRGVGDSKEFVVCIPTWLNHHGWFDDAEIVDRILRGGVWAWDCFLRNTDAVELGIPVKFWVDTALKPLARPFLEENGIDWDRDVLEADILKMSGGKAVPGGGQSMLLWLDSQLSDYKRVMYVAPDVFFLSGNKGRIPVFRKLLEMEASEMSMVFAYTNDSWLEHHALPRAVVDHGKSCLVWGGRDDNGRRFRDAMWVFGNTIQGYPDNFHGVYKFLREWELAGADMGFWGYDTDSLCFGWGFVSVYPREFMARERPEQVEELRRLALAVGHDEVVSCYLLHKNRQRFPSMVDAVGLKLIHLDSDREAKELRDSLSEGESVFVHWKADIPLFGEFLQYLGIGGSE